MAVIFKEIVNNMGIVRMGPPEDVVLKIAKHYEISTFVETGTYEAVTTLWASKHFKEVFTIEAAELFYKKAMDCYGDRKNIRFIHGYSTVSLKELQVSFKAENKRAMFWLDAHWSGGETYGKEDECPLLEELKAVLDSALGHMVFVDDARLFLAPPPQPHDVNNWPVLTDIAKVAIESDYNMMLIEDVFVIYPQAEHAFMSDMFQGISTNEWNIYGTNIRRSVLSGVKIILKSLLEGRFK